MKRTIKEMALIVASLLPLAYFASVYDQLPDKIPTHFNYEGIADDYSEKSNFIWMLLSINIGIYLLLLILPLIDPKKRIEQMGNHYFKLRVIFAVFASLMMFYLIHVCIPGNQFNPNVLMGLVALLFAMFGNYFQALRPNYFIGIRTPWTLENESIWKKTHHLAGRIWLIGGSMMFLLSFVLERKFFAPVFLVSVAIMAIFPIVHSFKLSRNMKSTG